MPFIPIDPPQKCNPIPWRVPMNRPTTGADMFAPMLAGFERAFTPSEPILSGVVCELLAGASTQFFF
jgi:hypothetical protein